MDTRERILKISFDLFLDSGYNNTTFSELVKASGLSKGAFYHYFQSKEKLYNEVINIFFLSTFTALDWKELNNFNLSELKLSMKHFYINFIEKINLNTNKGLSRYFIMFFEAFENHATFKNEIRTFYKKLKALIDVLIKKENSSEESMHIISKFEGILFWHSLFPEEKVQKLIMQI